jgi:hypothetical protein
MAQKIGNKLSVEDVELAGKRVLIRYAEGSQPTS